jgi:hypothetical protein
MSNYTPFTMFHSMKRLYEKCPDEEWSHYNKIIPYRLINQNHEIWNVSSDRIGCIAVDMRGKIGKRTITVCIQNRVRRIRVDYEVREEDDNMRQLGVYIYKRDVEASA